MTISPRGGIGERAGIGERVWTEPKGISVQDQGSSPREQPFGAEMGFETEPLVSKF